jgi:hypothetical protein
MEVGYEEVVRGRPGGGVRHWEGRDGLLSPAASARAGQTQSVRTFSSTTVTRSLVVMADWLTELGVTRPGGGWRPP